MRAFRLLGFHGGDVSSQVNVLVLIKEYMNDGYMTNALDRTSIHISCRIKGKVAPVLN
jgi:hypothetical protein